MSDTTENTTHWCEFTKTWPDPEICITCGEEAPVLYDSDTSSSGDADKAKSDDPVVEKASKEEKVYAAVRSTPFMVSKKVKVGKSKKPKKGPKKTVKINGFYKKLFEDYPLFLPTSPPFSDGQIDEFQCQECGVHKDLDDETWNECPYAIFHGIIPELNKKN